MGLLFPDWNYFPATQVHHFGGIGQLTETPHPAPLAPVFTSYVQLVACMVPVSNSLADSPPIEHVPAVCKAES